jgi:crotonobetainyl-CoA:carnitine CoA-transferase CaiB-like acyl-CoA transferase
VAIACRSDSDWQALAALIDEPWAQDPRFRERSSRLTHQDELDRRLADFTRVHDKFELAARARDVGVPASAVQTPAERIEEDPSTRDFGLWPTVTHSQIGEVRVDGLPFHLSRTDGEIRRGAPCLGEHNDYVFGELLGLSRAELDALREEGVV